MDVRIKISNNPQNVIVHR